MPTPGDLEAATKLMVKEAIHAGAGDFDPARRCRLLAGVRRRRRSRTVPFERSGHSPAAFAGAR